MSPAIPVSEEHQTTSRPASGDAPGPGPAHPQIDVRLATSSDDPGIERLLTTLGGSVFQSPAWRRSVQRVFGHQPRDLVAYRDGELLGVLPLMRCRSLLGSSHLISTPYGVYGGPLAADQRTRTLLVDRALKEARDGKVGRLELRSREDLNHPGLASSDRYVTFVKELPADPELVIASMKKDERRLVRRAADKHGLELDEGAWYLEDLARLFHSSKQRLGSPGLPREWFRALITELGERAPVHIVRRGSEVLAASMSFVDGQALRMYYIGTATEANRSYAATSFMISQLQQWAIERGLAEFDLGRSRSDAGAVRFKTNQGFHGQPLHYCYGLIRTKTLPSFTPSNPRTKLLRKTWAGMPAWTCKQLSARLSRFLP